MPHAKSLYMGGIKPYDIGEIFAMGGCDYLTRDIASIEDEEEFIRGYREYKQRNDMNVSPHLWDE